jgi:hypothetical protein
LQDEKPLSDKKRLFGPEAERPPENFHD